MHDFWCSQLSMCSVCSSLVVHTIVMISGSRIVGSTFIHFVSPYHERLQTHRDSHRANQAQHSRAICHLHSMLFPVKAGKLLNPSLDQTLSICTLTNQGCNCVSAFPRKAAADRAHPWAVADQNHWNFQHANCINPWLFLRHVQSTQSEFLPC